MTQQLIWFSVAVLPLVIIPGPDMLLCVAQGLTRGYSGVWKAVNGITLGYLAHAILAALGVAALVAASPLLFETVRWIGIAYLCWIAFSMLKTAAQATQTIQSLPSAPPLTIWRGFLTSFLNPKGLFVYLSIVPQFINVDGNVKLQAFALSLTNTALCFVVYVTVGMLAARSSQSKTVSATRTRVLEGLGGAMLGGVAIYLSVSR